MDNIEYNIGLPGYTPLGVDGKDGNNGYAVHISTIPLDGDETTTITSCITGNKPLSNNSNVRGSGSEMYGNSDIIIDDFGNFAQITDVSTGDFIIFGKIFQYSEESSGDVYDSSFQNAPTIVFIYDSSISKYSQNKYNYYSFDVPFKYPTPDGIDNPLYRYKANTNKNTYTVTYKANGDGKEFINTNLPKCYYAKIIITFSTGLTYEQTITNTAKDYRITIDNRYYYGYGRGVTTPADTDYACYYDSSYGGPSDSEIWQGVKVIGYAGAPDASNYRETSMGDICRHINGNIMNGETVEKYSIVNARMEFYHKDGNIYNVKIELD